MHMLYVYTCLHYYYTICSWSAMSRRMWKCMKMPNMAAWLRPMLFGPLRLDGHRAGKVIEFLWFVPQDFFDLAQEFGMQLAFLLHLLQSCKQISLTLLVCHDLSLDLFQFGISFMSGHYLHIPGNARDPSCQGFSDPSPNALYFLHQNPGFSFHNPNLFGF